MKNKNNIENKSKGNENRIYKKLPLKNQKEKLKLKKNEKNKKQKQTIVIVHTMEWSAARTAHYNIALLKMVYTDV